MFPKRSRLAFVLGLLAASTCHAQVPKEKPKDTVISITAEELAKEYMKGIIPSGDNATLAEKLNEAELRKQAIRNADTKFQYKRIELTGRVLDTGKITNSSGVYVSFEVSGSIPVHANFFGKDKDAIAFAMNLRKGDVIKVVGACGGYSTYSGNVELGRCSGTKIKDRDNK